MRRAATPGIRRRGERSSTGSASSGIARPRATAASTASPHRPITFAVHPGINASAAASSGGV
jgi:hypothetical protein